MYLDTTTKSIDVIMAEAATSVNPDYVVAYDDITTTTFTPIAGDGTLNGTSVVSIVPAPAGSTERHIKYISINNVDTVNHVITVRYNDNSTNRIMIKYTLLPGENLSYIEGFGWQANQIDGTPKRGNSTAIISQFIKLNDHDAANTSSTFQIASGFTYAFYLGQATKVSSSINVVLNVTTNISGVTYAEIGIAKSATNNMSNSSAGAAAQPVIQLGFADTSGIINTTGIKNIAISLTTNTAIGDDLWLTFSNSDTGDVVIAAGISGIGPQLDSRTSLNLASGPRLSTVAGFTLTANNNGCPWAVAYLN